MKDLKTSIIILTYNQLEYTKKCLDSIRKYTKSGYELIIVDNYSTDGTREWLKEQQGILTILNSKNEGFPKGCNQGIKIAKGDNILLLNNDTIVTPNWLTNLITCLYSSENIGAVGPVSNSCAYYQTIPVDYESEDGIEDFAEAYNVTDQLKWEDRVKLIGFCMLIKKSVLDKVGLLDERFTPGNYEDDDLSVRILKAGYRLVLCKDTFIHHFGGTSFKKNDKYTQLLLKNEKKFQQKWGFNSREKMEIIGPLHEMVDKEKKINLLEINCGCGQNLLALKSKHKNISVFGIEENNRALSVAKDFVYLKYKKKLENDNFNDIYMDYIILNNFHEKDIDMLNNLNSKGDEKYIFVVKNENYLKEEKGNNFIEATIRLLLNKGFDIVDSMKYKIENHSEDIITSSLKVDSIKYYLLKAIKRERQTMREILIAIDNGINVEDNFSKIIEQLKNSYKVEELLEIIKKEVNNKVDILNTIAVLCYSNEIVDPVIPLFNKALEYDRENYSVLMNLSDLYYQIGEYELAYNHIKSLKENTEEKENLQKQIEEKYNFIRGIKFALRRLEFSVNEVETEEYIEKLVKDREIDDQLILEIVDKDIINKVYILNYVAVKAFQLEYYDIILPLLQKALDIETLNLDANYNLGYVLYNMGEKDMAYSYLMKIKGKNSEIDEFIFKVKEEIEI